MPQAARLMAASVVLIVIPVLAVYVMPFCSTRSVLRPASIIWTALPAGE